MCSICIISAEFGIKLAGDYRDEEEPTQLDQGLDRRHGEAIEGNRSNNEY